MTTSYDETKKTTHTITVTEAQRELLQRIVGDARREKRYPDVNKNLWRALAKNIGLALLALTLALPGCGSASLGPDTDAGGALDGPLTAADAAVVPEDAQTGEDASQGQQDGYTAPTPGSCNPDRSPDDVSSADCRRYADAPVCDAITERCSPPPTALCGACETDEQCQAVDIYARCVFIPGDVPSNNDSACLVPCDSGCGWVGDAYDWTAPASCFDLPDGSFCAPDWHRDITHCRNPDGTRQGG